MQNVAVVIVHGINTDAGFSRDFTTAVKKKLTAEQRSRAAFSEVYWAADIRDRQDAFVRSLTSKGVKRYKPRDFVVQALGDAAAYQKTRRLENSVYFDVQQSLLKRLNSLAVSEGPEVPVIFVGHSLGCHIVSSFAWDVHNWRRRTDEQIEQESDEGMRAFARSIRTGPPIVRLETFAGFITLGNNMPLFTFTFGPKKVFPITTTPYANATPAFPGCGLPEHIKAKARWINIFSPRDPLGFPLAALNDAYAQEKRIQDIPWHVEPWYWPSPLDAHVKYWTNKKVVQESSKLIAEVIEAAPE